VLRHAGDPTRHIASSLIAPDGGGSDCNRLLTALEADNGLESPARGGNMKAMAKTLLSLFTVILAQFSVSAQSPSPDFRFGGHTLGEPADVFFLTARVANSKQLTKDYCKTLLDDPNVKEKAQEKDDVAKNGGVFTLTKKDFSVLDVGNCRQMLAALSGEQASVGARLAAELGKGSALFSSGRLSAFNLTVGSSFDDTVADMARRFGGGGRKDYVARVGWPPLQEMRWERDGVLAAVWKNQFTDGAIVVIGFLEPPYDSFLRGTIIPESSATTPPCEAAPSGPLKRIQVPPGIMAGLLNHRVQPSYPDSAKQSKIQGVVVVDAVVDECGHVVEVNPISGPPELIPAAVTAVKQWEYRPYISSGQPVAVETQLRLNFKLAH
jgi:TonB family protein